MYFKKSTIFVCLDFLCCCCNCSCQRMTSSINSGNPLDSANIFKFFLCSAHQQSFYKKCLTSLFQSLLPTALTLIFFSFFSSLAIIDISHFKLQTTHCSKATTAAGYSRHITALWTACQVCTLYNPCCDAAADAVKDVQ